MVPRLAISMRTNHKHACHPTSLPIDWTWADDRLQDYHVSEIYEMAGHFIRRLNQISISIFSESMAENGYDLTPVQFAAMSTLKFNPGVDQATLAGMIAYDRVTIGGVVDRLEQKGFVRRVVSVHDRRSRELYLTDEGLEVLTRVLPIVEKLQGDILQGLDNDEKKQFLMLIKKAASAGNSLSRAPLKFKDRQ